MKQRLVIQHGLRRALDSKGDLLLCAAQFNNASKTGVSALPIAVKPYSTFGGT
jgi:hypothetical protein